MQVSSQIWMKNNKTSNHDQCKLNQLKSNYFALCWQLVYVFALVKACFFSDCAKFAVGPDGFAWSQDR